MASQHLTPVELGQRHVLPGWHGQVGRILPSHYKLLGNFLKSLQFHGKNHQQKLRFSTKKHQKQNSQSLCSHLLGVSEFQTSQNLVKNPSDGQDRKAPECELRAFNRLMMQLASCLGHLKLLESEKLHPWNPSLQDFVRRLEFESELRKRSSEISSRIIYPNK